MKNTYFLFKGFAPAAGPPASCWLAALKFIDFMCFVGPFLNILGSWEITVASIWWSFGARAHSGELLNVPMWIFDDFWVPRWGHFSVTFSYFMWFEVSKSMFGLQAWFLMISDWKNWWFLMSQPLKHIEKIWFSLDFTFLTFWWFRWFQVPLGTSFWRSLEVSRHHFDDFWGYWEFLGISLNSMVWLAGTRIQSTHPGEGKKVDPRGPTATNNSCWKL